eukprot:TRINITY_DN1312_c0_g1_i2.p1 TRINITY_DN1312_c0_g1~~TRINITY_DN1312_c0_g1_i2.p1  ORF type:complete len:364 (-),score=145.52 TRINITY_DN1312_c0_g1_i2:469-1488(-)
MTSHNEDDAEGQSPSKRPRINTNLRDEFAFSPSIAKIGTPGGTPRTGTVHSPYSPTMDVRLVAVVIKLLKRKEGLLKRIGELNDMADKQFSDANGNPAYLPNFQKLYALCLMELEKCNQNLKMPLLKLRARPKHTSPRYITPTPTTPSSNATGSTGGSKSRSLGMGGHGGPAKALFGDPMTPNKESQVAGLQLTGQQIQELNAINNTCENTALQLVTDIKDKLTAMNVKYNLAGEEEDDQRTDDPEKRNDNDDDDEEEGLSSEDINTLVTNCVSILLKVQAVSEKTLTPAEVSQALEQAAQTLRPKSAENLGIYRDIQESIARIKNTLVTVDVGFENEM